VNHGDYPQRSFIRRIGNQIFAHQKEPQWSTRQFWAPVTRVGKRDDAPNRRENLFADPSGSNRTIPRNLLPNVGNVLRRKQMKGKPPLHGY